MLENNKRWMELCERAADEQDPRKLAALILQINYILEAKGTATDRRGRCARSSRGLYRKCSPLKFFDQLLCFTLRCCLNSNSSDITNVAPNSALSSGSESCGTRGVLQPGTVE